MCKLVGLKQCDGLDSFTGEKKIFVTPILNYFPYVEKEIKKPKQPKKKIKKEDAASNSNTNDVIEIKDDELVEINDENSKTDEEIAEINNHEESNE